MVSNSLLLIVVDCGFASSFKPSFEAIGILAIVSIARVRGRIQSMIAAAVYTVFVIVVFRDGPVFREPGSNQIELISVLCSAWLCSFLASTRTANVASSTIPDEGMNI